MTSGGSPRDRSATGVLLAVPVLAVLALAVLVAAALGPVHLVAEPGPSVTPPPAPSFAVTGTPRPADTVAEPPRAEPARTVSVRPQDVLALLLVLAAAALGWLLVRARRAGARRDPPDRAGDATAPPDPALVLAECLAADLGRAARDGAALLRDAGPRSSADLVVACWLRLEDVAAAAGRARRPEQTATAFTAGVLEALSADPAAVADLLGLYHRARFGSRPLPADAVDRAVAALDRIVAGAGGAAGAVRPAGARPGGGGPG